MLLLSFVNQVENKVKARQQAEKVAQKEANKIKQKIEKKERADTEKKLNKKGRGAIQREKKRARKEEAKNSEKDENIGGASRSEDIQVEEKSSKRQKMLKPPKKQKRKSDGLDELINEYKSSFTKGVVEASTQHNKQSTDKNATNRASVVKRRWFE